jgi:hypothetical protein
VQSSKLSWQLARSSWAANLRLCMTI